MDTTDLDPDFDSRLLTFAEQIRIRSDLSVAVDGNKIIVGGPPNCAIVSSLGEDSKVSISFHRECHPLTVVTILTVLLSAVEPAYLQFDGGCFLSDVRGVVSYESEPGFDLLHLQFLRDYLGIRSHKIFSA